MVAFMSMCKFNVHTVCSIVTIIRYNQCTRNHLTHTHLHNDLSTHYAHVQYYTHLCIHNTLTSSGNVCMDIGCITADIEQESGDHDIYGEFHYVTVQRFFMLLD